MKELPKLPYDYYDHPVKLIQEQVKMNFDDYVEGEIAKVTCKYCININETNLIQALAQDRERYETAYRNGFNEALQGITRCRDCIYLKKSEDSKVSYSCRLHGSYCDEDDFCSWAIHQKYSNNEDRGE